MIQCYICIHSLRCFNVTHVSLWTDHCWSSWIIGTFFQSDSSVVCFCFVHVSCSVLRVFCLEDFCCCWLSYTIAGVTKCSLDLRPFLPISWTIILLKLTGTFNRVNQIILTFLLEQVERTTSNHCEWVDQTGQVFASIEFSGKTLAQRRGREWSGQVLCRFVGDHVQLGSVHWFYTSKSRWSSAMHANYSYSTSESIQGCFFPIWRFHSTVQTIDGQCG